MEEASQEGTNIQDLPHDVLVEIFSYLKVQVLAKTVSLVCKSWRDLSRDASLWRAFQFKWNPNLVSQTRTELARCTQLRTLIIDAPVPAMSVVCNLDETFSFPTLKSLTINNGMLNMSLLADFDNRFPQLECFRLHRCYVEMENQQGFIDGLSNLSTLKGLELHLETMYALVDEDFVDRVARTFINLERIDLLNSKTLSTRCIGNLVKLRRNKLTEVKVQNSLISDEAVSFFRVCPKLISLGLRCTANITNVSFDFIRDLKLECLELQCWTSLNHNISQETLLRFFQSPTRLPLLRLALGGFVNLSDDILREVVTHCPKLRELIVGATDLVTNEGVIFCGNFLPNLTYLAIKECRNVTQDIREAIPRNIELMFVASNI